LVAGFFIAGIIARTLPELLAFGRTSSDPAHAARWKSASVRTPWASGREIPLVQRPIAAKALGYELAFGDAFGFDLAGQ
jgi:hypothetical protein